MAKDDAQLTGSCQELDHHCGMRSALYHELPVMLRGSRSCEAEVSPPSCCPAPWVPAVLPQYSASCHPRQHC